MTRAAAQTEAGLKVTDLNVGDKALVLRRCKWTLTTVTKVTKTQITAYDGTRYTRFMRHTGAEYGSGTAERLWATDTGFLYAATPELMAEIELG